MTRTLIVSDLHLGGLSGVDLLRRPELRASLLGGARRTSIAWSCSATCSSCATARRTRRCAAARPFFEDVGRALGGEGELVVTAGNHDHLLVCGWLDARALGEPAPEPLGLEQRFGPDEASPMLAQIARWASPARVTVAYPGVWVRPDVYATHGHFLDCHLTIPTLERIGVGVMGRLLERPAGAIDTVDGYEAVTAPIYAWRDAITRYARAGPVLNGLATGRAWRALGAATAPEAAREPSAASAERGEPAISTESAQSGESGNRRELAAGQADAARGGRLGAQERDQGRVPADGRRR